MIQTYEEIRNFLNNFLINAPLQHQPTIQK